MEHSLKVRPVRIVAGKTFVFVAEKIVIFIKGQLTLSIFGTLFELYTDTATFVSDAVFSGIDCDT